MSGTLIETRFLIDLNCLEPVVSLHGFAYVCSNATKRLNITSCPLKSFALDFVCGTSNVVMDSFTSSVTCSSVVLIIILQNVVVHFVITRQIVIWGFHKRPECVFNELVKMAKNAPQSTAQESSSTTRSPFVSPPSAKKRSSKFLKEMFHDDEVDEDEAQAATSTVDIETQCEAELQSFIRVTKNVPDDVMPGVCWKLHAKAYPIMAKLARKWLGCIATSVTSERAFSTSGNIVSIRRCSLAPDMVRDLVFIALNIRSLSPQTK